MPVSLLRLFIRWKRLPLLAATDLLLMAGVVGMVFGLLSLGGEWTHAMRPAANIDLSLRALPRYTFYSLSRGMIAYFFSLSFTLIYGYWAAKDAVAEKILVPLLDILQSVPVLGFMPGLVLALVAAFPRSNMGLELACVLMIFTGQAWNMTFSYYQSLKSVPPDLREAADAYRFDWRRRLIGVELPYAAMGLVWNSMMSMAGGWFFLTITESFVLGDRDFRLPGIGSYMSAAVGKGDAAAMAWAVLAMSAMIIMLDQLLWRPVVAWAQKFRVDDAGARDPAKSWFLDFLKRSGVVAFLRTVAKRILPKLPAGDSAALPSRESFWGPRAARVFLVVLLGMMGLGLLKLVALLGRVPGRGWLDLSVAAAWTLSRVILSTALGTLWAVPAGLAIGLSPRLSRTFQPVVQVVASFPAPMLFPAAVAVFAALGLGLGWGSVALMLLGTQWYILFNAVAGAMAIPADLLEAARAYGLTPWQKLTRVYLPASFSFLVTGWVTAAGGAWNASIVAEYVTDRGHVLTANGLGARISVAAEHGDLSSLAAGVVLMSAVVVVFNRAVWRRLYGLAETKFSLSR